MTNFMAVANQKGGVGKTTIAMHLAALAHETGQHVLLVDLDQQGSATYLASGDANKHRCTEGTVLDLWNDQIEKLPVQESVFGFDYLQACHELDAVDDDLDAALKALSRLTEYGYDLVIFDCPPAPGVRQIAPLLMADRHLVPITADALGTQGLVSAYTQFQQLIQPRNPDMDFRVIVNLHKLTSATQKAVIEQLQARMGRVFVEQVLTDRESVKHALRAGKPIWNYSKEPFAEEWRAACEAVLLPAEEDEHGSDDAPEDLYDEDIALNPEGVEA